MNMYLRILFAFINYNNENIEEKNVNYDLVFVVVEW